MVESELSLKKWDVLGPIFFGGGEFHGGTTIPNNTAKTTSGEDLVKISPAVADQSYQEKNKFVTDI